ncbi:MAG: DUF4097 family beta strand repeat-containing protein [Pyrinomonadaceae bacterium]
MRVTQFISLIIKLALAVALTVGFAGILAAQTNLAKGERKAGNYQFCSSDNAGWDNDRVSVHDLRESTVAATGSLNVDGGRNGGVRVTGENRSDVLVRACVQTWDKSEESARAALANVKISTASTIRAEGGDGSNYSVSYEIRVPRSTDLSLKAHNGGISIAGVEGRLEFETTNGGVSLSDIAGDVEGRTTNGGVNVALSGNSWKGTGLDVQTSNGGVRLEIPENYAANIETGTTNGGFRSNIAALNIALEDRKGPDSYSRGTRLNTVINGGGAPIRVITTNGGVQINSTERSKAN